MRNDQTREYNNKKMKIIFPIVISSLLAIVISLLTYSIINSKFNRINQTRDEIVKLNKKMERNIKVLTTAIDEKDLDKRFAEYQAQIDKLTNSDTAKSIFQGMEERLDKLENQVAELSGQSNEPLGEINSRNSHLIWLSQQPKDNCSLQIASLIEKKMAEAFIEKNKLEALAYIIPQVREDTIRMNVFIGSHKTNIECKETALKIKRTKQLSSWTRKFKDIIEDLPPNIERY